MRGVSFSGGAVFSVLRNPFFRFCLISAAAALILFELLTAAMLSVPRLARFGPRAFLSGLYLNHFRSILHLEPGYARYDPDLKYTLRPGVFWFSNSEFCDEFRVNRLGTRDDGGDLEAPEIVVAGDSVPMGWGVGQEETFAAIVQRRTDRKVLNAAVSGYSTVQAVRILDRIDTSKMRFLILSYNRWNYPENAAYYRLRGKFKGIGRDAYERASAGYRRARRYYPMKYATIALSKLARRVFRMPGVEGSRVLPPPRPQMKAFLSVLAGAGHADLSAARVIVLCDKEFAEPMKRMAASGNYPSFVKNLIPVVLPEIRGGYAYILDDHPNARWHGIVADRLSDVLEEMTGAQTG